MTRYEFEEKLKKFLEENLSQHHLETETFRERLGFSFINFNIGTSSDSFDAVLVDDEDNEIPIQTSCHSSS